MCLVMLMKTTNNKCSYTQSKNNYYWPRSFFLFLDLSRRAKVLGRYNSNSICRSRVTAGASEQTRAAAKVIFPARTPPTHVPKPRALYLLPISVHPDRTFTNWTFNNLFNQKTNTWCRLCVCSSNNVGIQNQIVRIVRIFSISERNRTTKNHVKYTRSALRSWTVFITQNVSSTWHLRVYIQFRSRTSIHCPWSNVHQFIQQWLFARHPYGDLYFLFVREYRIFVEFLCNYLFLSIQNVICLFRYIN